MLIQIAWRNVWRNRTRSLVIIAAIALGLWAGIFSDAFMLGMTEQQVYNTIHTETGHVQINKPAFLVNHDLQLRMNNADSVLVGVRKTPGVKAAAARIQLMAMASTAANSAGIMVNGIDPDSQRSVSDLEKLLMEGAYFPSDRSNRILIGKQLAEKLKVRLNSRIVLTLQTAAGDITYSSFKVSGIFQSFDSEFDKQMVFVRKSELQPLLQLPQESASVITVLTNSLEDVDAVEQALQRQLPDLQVQNWKKLSPMVEVTVSTIMQFSLVFVGIILFALAFGIVNVMLMSVLDRTREIGMLMSIGMRPARVFRMILLETIFLSFTGAIIGVSLSAISVAYFGKTGINLSSMSAGFNAVGFSSIVYPSLGLDFYANITLMVVVIALLAGVFPARRAIKMRPADALRGE